MPTCPLCGTPLDAAARFCSQCGAAVRAAPGESPGQGELTEPTPKPAGTAPGANGISEESWAVFAHLSALVPLLVSLPLTFVGPLVLWLLARERGAFALDQSVEALNFNISWLLWGLVLVVAGVAVAVPTLGLALIPVGLLLLALVIAWLILVIIAAVRASRGERYRYPLTIRFVTR